MNPTLVFWIVVGALGIAALMTAVTGALDNSAQRQGDALNEAIREGREVNLESTLSNIGGVISFIF